MNRVHGWLCNSGLWARHAERSLVPWVMDSVDLGPKVLEIGPGYGVTTRILSKGIADLTALEVDIHLARSLADRIEAVRVLNGDGAAMPFDDQAFSGVVCLTMLHHVPTQQLQDQLFAEAYRVLKPGGSFAGSDSRSSLGFRLIHLSDTMVIVDPGTLGVRLQTAGFEHIHIEKRRGDFRFQAQRPGAAASPSDVAHDK